MKAPTLALGMQLGVLLLLSVPLTVAAQTREARALEGFDAIEVGGGIDLNLRRGSSFAVEVEGSVASIITEVHEKTLTIRRKGAFNFFSWSNPGAVHVTLPVLVSLVASGGSDVRAEGQFSSDALKIVASGGSDVSYSGAPRTVDVKTSGGSDVHRR